MKKILILLAFFSPLALNAYYGDIQNFIIDGNSICLNAPAVASKSYISEDSKVSKNATWQAEITLSFSPTSSNYLKWFIMADSTNVNASSSAYYLMFGGTKRTIAFYYQKNGKSTLVHEEQEKLLDNSLNQISVAVKRLESDDWILEYTLNDTLTNVSEFYSDEVNYSSYLGWHCVYTKTRSQSFCFANKKVVGEVASTPRIPQKGELLINEVLFNPVGDGVDFIEIYNASDTIFDLSLCLLGNKKQTYSIPYFILHPDSCVAITRDSLVLCGQFECVSPINILQVDKMLPLPNDSGYVRLMVDTMLIDSLPYHVNMHHAMLDNVEGISLERSNDGTWHSASTIVRATPGYKNSRFIDDENNESTSDNNTQETDSNFIKLQSSTVHIYDLEMPEKVELLYRMHNDYRLSVKVYTLAGYPVYTILESELISGEGKLYWDGRGDDSGVLPVGLYVIVAEFYSSEGEYRMEKMPVAIVP
jgi:hypothetical protein